MSKFQKLVARQPEPVTASSFVALLAPGDRNEIKKINWQQYF
jgi:hypothetical protein